MDETSARDARHGEEAEAAQDLTSLLADETRRIQGDDSKRSQILQDETILLGKPGPAHLSLTADETPAEPEAAGEKPTRPAHFAPGVGETVVMEPPVPEEAPAEPAPSTAARLDDILPEVHIGGQDQADEDDALDSLDELALDEPDEVPEADVNPGATAIDLTVPGVEQPMPEPAPADAAVPGVIPVDPTVLRPLPKQVGEEHLVVRNTRDYDHDAQSVNVVAGADNFDTIVERDTDRGVRRDPYARSSLSGSVPGEGNSRSKLRPLLAILLVALVIGGGAAAFAYGMELWGGKSVPYVIGESQANAELRLSEKGLTVRVEAEPADDAIGKVLSQSPESGERVPEGSQVTIIVATNRTMPDVVGLSREEAEKALHEAGAENITTKSKPSSKPEGTVIEVSPEAGEAFVSRSQVTLTVATPFTVPDVVGKKESDALEALKEASLKGEVSYVVSDKTVRTVVETSPAAGEVIEEGGTVQVKVSSPYPTDIHHLAEFFSHSSQDVDGFLLSKNFSFERGGIDNLGNAVQTYTSSDQGELTFSSQPHVRGLKLPKEGSANVLATGAPIAAGRLDCPSHMIPAGFDREALEGLAKECGLKGLDDTCRADNMTLPAGAPRVAANFGCASGEMGDMVWTVLVVNANGTTRASVTCAKEDIYKSSDLAPFGGSLCRYAAYQEVYLSSEYQVHEEKKDDAKDDKGNDGSEDGGQQQEGEGQEG